ncbi:MAG: nuclear transport factor 2 family protein [Rhodospirillaceae bacterium]|nr:nuclear transport factor 2 family protein [Rhodospirillaceae bacterium]
MGTPESIAGKSFQVANEAFYHAFSNADAAAMGNLWAQGFPVFCCHPGWPPILTRAEIVASWKEIFSHGARLDISFVAQQTALIGAVGVVCGVEMVGNSQFACTNIFVVEAERWRMVHHHAGPLAPGTIAAIATPVDPGHGRRH